MADFTAATRNAQIDWLTGKATPAAVATRYITTFNGDPQAGGTENINTITGSVNRIDVTTPMGVSAGGSAANASDITITNAAVGAATVDHVAIMSAITGGVVMASTPVTSKSVGIGDSLKILIGNLTIGIT